MEFADLPQGEPELSRVPNKTDERERDLSVVSVAKGSTWGLLQPRGALIKAQRLDGDASPFGQLSYAQAFILPANRV